METKRHSNQTLPWQELLALVIIVCMITILFLTNPDQVSLFSGHPHAEYIVYFRKEIEKKREMDITALIDEDHAIEDLHQSISGTCTILSLDAINISKQNCKFQNRQMEAILSVAFASNGYYISQHMLSDIWIKKVEYPSHEEDTCLTFEFQDYQDRLWKASLKENCRNMHRLIERWFQAKRDSIKDVPETDPHYEMGSREYGVSFKPTNPAHFEMKYYTRYPTMLASYPLTNLTIKNGLITAQQLNNDLTLQTVQYDAWKARLYPAMDKYIKFVESHDRAYVVGHVIGIEGDKSNDEMTQNANLIWRAKEKVFDVTTEDNKFLGRIESRKEIEVLKADKKSGKIFDGICMKFELKAAVSGPNEKFQVKSNCELVYFDILKMEEKL